LAAVVVLLDEVDEVDELELDVMDELEVVLGVLVAEELDVEEEELGVGEELDDDMKLEEAPNEELEDELGVREELEKLEKVVELGELDLPDDESVLEDFWAPGVATMNTPIPRIIKTPTAASATLLLFKRVSQFSRAI